MSDDATKLRADIEEKKKRLLELKARRAITTYEYDPEKDGPGEEIAAANDVGPEQPNAGMGYEVFEGKVYSAEQIEQASLREQVRQTASKRAQFVNFQKSQVHFESPVERLHRLKSEVEQFQADLEMMSSTQPLRDISVCNGVGSDLAKLEGGLGAVLGDNRVAPYLPSSIPLGAAGVASSQRALAGALVGSVGGKGNAQLSASLYQNVDGEQAALLDLSRRIDELERFVGSGSNKDTSLHVSLTAIREQCSLLDEHILDAVYRRIKSLLSDVELAEGQSKAGSAGGVAIDKIQELHTLMDQWHKLTDLVPQMVERLKTQKEVHERHADSLVRTQRLQLAQATIGCMVTDDKAAVSAALTGFEANIKLMQANAKAFDARFAALQAKLK